MIRNFLLLTFLSFSISLVAGTTKITGLIPGGENYEIRLHTFEDYISFKSIILDRTQVDSSGRFELLAELNQTISVWIEIEFYKTDLYLIPDAKYFIEFDPVKIKDEYRPFYNKEYLSIAGFSEPEPKINQLIEEYDKLFSDFVSTTYGGIRMVRNVLPIITFQQSTDSIFADVDDEFFRSHRDYKTAVLQMSIHPKKKNELFLEYVNNREILYFHPEYMDFFNALFSDLLTGNNRFISRADLLSTINYQKSYPALLDSLGKDTLLRNEKIRELVLLEMLNHFYSSNLYDKSALLDVLQQIKENSKFTEHRMIAKNIISELTKLEVGFESPQFTLPNLSGDTLYLTDFLGKPIYLGFFTTSSYACLAEFKLFDTLFQTYGEKINFISISLDANPEVIKQFKDEKGYDWTFLYNGTQYNLLHDYNIKTYPTFVLIDKMGKIAEYPAYKPSEVIEGSFKKLLTE